VGQAVAVRHRRPASGPTPVSCIQAINAAPAVRNAVDHMMGADDIATGRTCPADAFPPVSTRPVWSANRPPSVRPCPPRPRRASRCRSRPDDGENCVRRDRARHFTGQVKKPLAGLADGTVTADGDDGRVARVQRPGSWPRSVARRPRFRERQMRYLPPSSLRERRERYAGPCGFGMTISNVVARRGHGCI